MTLSNVYLKQTRVRDINNAIVQYPSKVITCLRGTNNIPKLTTASVLPKPRIITLE